MVRTLSLRFDNRGVKPVSLLAKAFLSCNGMLDLNLLFAFQCSMQYTQHACVLSLSDGFFLLLTMRFHQKGLLMGRVSLTWLNRAACFHGRRGAHVVEAEAGMNGYVLFMKIGWHGVGGADAVSR